DLIIDRPDSPIDLLGLSLLLWATAWRGTSTATGWPWATGQPGRLLGHRRQGREEAHDQHHRQHALDLGHEHGFHHSFCNGGDCGRNHPTICPATMLI